MSIMVSRVGKQSSSWFEETLKKIIAKSQENIFGVNIKKSFSWSLDLFSNENDPWLSWLCFYIGGYFELLLNLLHLQLSFSKIQIRLWTFKTHWVCTMCKFKPSANPVKTIFSTGKVKLSDETFLDDENAKLRLSVDVKIEVQNRQIRDSCKYLTNIEAG